MSLFRSVIHFSNVKHRNNPFDHTNSAFKPFQYVYNAVICRHMVNSVGKPGQNTCVLITVITKQLKPTCYIYINQASLLL